MATLNPLRSGPKVSRGSDPEEEGMGQTELLGPWEKSIPSL